MRPLFCILILILSLVSVAATLELKSCHKKRSQTKPQEIEVHCSCLEQQIDFSEPIYMLTVNQTGCSRNVLKLDWNTLQNYTKVKKVVFDHAAVVFGDYKEELTSYSIREVEFYNSDLKKIPATAFSGLQFVEVFRFVESEIGIIEPKVFSGFQHLKTIEFAKTKILHIQEDAFWDLPNLEELAIISSNLSVVEPSAIHLLDKDTSTTEGCPSEMARSGRTLNGVMDMIAGRSLHHIQNITFPEYGRKLIFYNSDVRLLRSRSINTNAFAYIIFGGNEIDTVEKQAFEAEFKNECDISAFLLIHNKLNIVESEAFLGIAGQKVEPYKAIFALVENTFYRVDRKGFSVNPNLEISFIEGNKFSCSCKSFSWILSNEHSDGQNRFEKSLVETGRCIGEYPLSEFLKSCDDVPVSPEFTTSSLKTSSTDDYYTVTMEGMVAGSEHFISSSGNPRHSCEIFNFFIAITLFLIFS